MKHLSSAALPSSTLFCQLNIYQDLITCNTVRTCLLEKEEKISGACTKRLLGGGASSSRIIEVRDGLRYSPGLYPILDIGVGVALGVPLGVQRGVARGVIRGVPWGVGNGVRLGVPMGVLDQDMRGVMESSMGQLHNSTISSLSFCSASGEEEISTVKFFSTRRQLTVNQQGGGEAGSSL